MLFCPKAGKASSKPSQANTAHIGVASVMKMVNGGEQICLEEPLQVFHKPWMKKLLWVKNLTDQPSEKTMTSAQWKSLWQSMLIIMLWYVNHQIPYIKQKFSQSYSMIWCFFFVDIRDFGCQHSEVQIPARQNFNSHKNLSRMPRSLWNRASFSLWRQDSSVRSCWTSSRQLFGKIKNGRKIPKIHVLVKYFFRWDRLLLSNWRF